MLVCNMEKAYGIKTREFLFSFHELPNYMGYRKCR